MKFGKRAITGILIVVLCVLVGAAVTATNRTNEKKIQTFMTGLTNEEVDKSFDDFFAGSRFASQPDVVKLLKDEYQEAVKTYGKAQSYELVKKQKYGDSIIRFVYVVKSDRLPLFWEFYFYKPASDWELITVSANFKGQYGLLADK